jgi:hypothetical protein
MGGIRMTKVIADITMSIDGFVTGPDPDLEHGLGHGGDALHTWVLSDDPVDAQVLESATERSGAVVMGGGDVFRQCVDEGLVDELVLHLSPLVLGAGTPLFAGASRRELRQREVRVSSNATAPDLRRRGVTGQGRAVRTRARKGFVSIAAAIGPRR